MSEAIRLSNIIHLYIIHIIQYLGGPDVLLPVF